MDAPERPVEWALLRRKYSAKRGRVRSRPSRPHRPKLKSYRDPVVLLDGSPTAADVFDAGLAQLTAASREKRVAILARLSSALMARIEEEARAVQLLQQRGARQRMFGLRVRVIEDESLWLSIRTMATSPRWSIRVSAYEQRARERRKELRAILKTLGQAREWKSR